MLLRHFRPSYDQSDHNWAQVAEIKSFFLELRKNGYSESLGVKTTYFTHQVSYLNLKGEGSSFKIDRFIGNYISNKNGHGRLNF